MQMYIFRTTKVALFILIFITSSLCLYSQTQSNKRSFPNKNKDGVKNEISPERQRAEYLLDSAIDELPGIEDIQARISLAESILKLLSKEKPDRCRVMLDALFDSALQLKEKDSSDKKAPKQDPDAIIRKIIQITAAFDRRLSQRYVEQYTKQDDAQNETTKLTNAHLAANLYMKLAIELIEKDPAFAIEIASKSLNSKLISESLVFLGVLRKKDSGLANAFFMKALQSLKTRQGNDVNEWLLLYSYVFSPMRIPQVTSQGLALAQLPQYLAVAENYTVEPDLANQYLQAVTQIFLDNTRYTPASIEGLSWRIVGDLYLISIVEPQFAYYLADSTQLITAQRNFLANYLQPEQRGQVQPFIDRWMNVHSRVDPASRNPNTTDYFLKLAEQSVDSKRRDQLYYKAASVAIGDKNYDLALEIVEKLSLTYRDDARQFINYHIALQSVQNHELEKAEQWVRRDSDRARQAYLLTLIANSLLEKDGKDLSRVRELLNEVTQLSTKAGANRDAAAILFGGALVFSRFDMARAFELFKEAITIANKVDGFTGDIWIVRSLNIGGFSFDYSMYGSEFTLKEITERLAIKNFNETLLTVQNLKAPLPRLRGIVALSKGVWLEKLSKQSSS